MIVAAHTRMWQPYCSQHHLLVSDNVLFLSNAVTTQEWSTVNDYRQGTCNSLLIMPSFLIYWCNTGGSATDIYLLK